MSNDTNAINSGTPDYGDALENNETVTYEQLLAETVEEVMPDDSFSGKGNAVLTKPADLKLNENQDNSEFTGNPISYPSDNKAKLTVVLNELMGALTTDEIKELLNDVYYKVLNESYWTGSGQDELISTVQDKDRRWVQEMVQDDIKLEPRYVNPRINAKTNTPKLASIIASQTLGYGKDAQIPIYGSYLFAMFSPMSYIEIERLYDKINFEVEEAGRLSWGAAFSSLSGILIQTILDAAIQNVKISIDLPDGHSVEDFILDNLRLTDYPIFLWGFISANFPNGVPYNRSCLNTAAKCNHVVTSQLNPLSAMYVDHNMFTTADRKFLAKQKASRIKLKEYQDYVAERTVAKTYELTPKLSVTLTVPNMRKFFVSTHSWIDGIKSAVEKANTATSHANKLDKINREIDATNLAQYAHWVSAITVNINGQTTLINKPSAIEQFIGELSSSKQAKTKFNNALHEFYHESISSTIAIPSYDCPACRYPNDDEGEVPGPLGLKDIIPLDVVRNFFALLGQRILSM